MTRKDEAKDDTFPAVKKEFPGMENKFSSVKNNFPNVKKGICSAGNKQRSRSPLRG